MGRGVGLRSPSKCAALMIAVLVASGSFMPCHAATESAGEMAGSCSGFANVQANGDGQFAMNMSAQDNVCWGAFAAIQELSTYTDAKGATWLGICAPPESTRLEYIHIFTRYVAIHPELEHRDFALVAVWALATSFPCRTMTVPGR